MVDMDALEAEIGEVTGHLNAQHARLVDLAIELLGNPEVWSGPGVWRADQYLNWKAGLAPHRARQIVTIAERAPELPLSMTAFRRGELSVDQMAAIAAKAPWWTDEEICDLGTKSTVRQLRNVLARYPFPEIPAPDEERAEVPDEGMADEAAAPDQSARSGEQAIEEAAPSDRWTAYFDDEGRYRLSVNTDQATGMVIHQGLVEARDALFHQGETEVRWVDALRTMAERSLDTIAEPSRRNRFRINIHLDTNGAATDSAGVRLPDSTRRFLSCDGLWAPVFVDNGLPVSVGRTQRIVPDRTRRLVELRDQGCRVPGCTHAHVVEIHHIIHWEDDGPTDTWNLVALCPNHHRLHHQAQLGISGNADDPDGLVFTNAVGRLIPQSGARPEPPKGPPPPPIGTYQPRLLERLDVEWLYFNPPLRHRPGLPQLN